MHMEAQPDPFQAILYLLDDVRYLLGLSTICITENNGLGPTIFGCF